MIQDIITTATLIGAVSAILAVLAAAYNWYREVTSQREEIKIIKQEQRLLVSGILACLKGLKEQGCNGPVTESITKIEEYLNHAAHD